MNEFAAHEEMVSNMIVNNDAFDQADFDRYREALALPGALTAIVNYYRANLGKNSLQKLILPRFGQSVSSTTFLAEQITVPALILYGEQDHFNSNVMFENADRWIDDLQLERFDNSSHWVHLECPDRMNEVLSEFLGGTHDGDTV